VVRELSRRPEAPVPIWVGTGIIRGIFVRMAMTLRLDEQETEALRRRAELEGRSMQDVARQAVRDYIERTSKRELLDRVLDEELPRYAEALERLGR
jgi:Ribbon-helix-helix protein, copG family